MRVISALNYLESSQHQMLQKVYMDTENMAC